MNDLNLSRRGLLRGAALGGLGMSPLFPAWAKTVSHGLVAKGSGTLSGTDIRLTVAEREFAVDGRIGHAVALNGTIPAPLVRLREGETVRIAVDNRLDEDTSIHWHGLIVPFQMDGVPGVSFPGIKARSTFTYEFPLRQAGTYWYHSHSGLQEQIGHYGPLIIDPAGPDPIASDREHVIVLSDWTFLHPHRVFERMKQEGGFFNRQKRTLADRLRGKPDPMTAEERDMFARMRMDPTDISDVTEAAYRFLVNGHSPAENWTGLFRVGERVRLRIINAATQTIFNLRIPGLRMTVVATDGIPVRPVSVDEFQIGNAETYDVIVTPEDRAYALVAETIDRSGMAVATLAPRQGLRAPRPPLRARPTLGMRDMGMDHGGGGGMDHAAMPGMNHGPTSPAAPVTPAMDHGAMDMRDESKVGFPVGVGVDMIAPMPADRTGDPGIGLDDVGHKVLSYRDLVALAPRADRRVPTRRIDIHLTGNMERFMWSMDGAQLSENPEPYRFARNERVRLRLINDTMMTHPMHLHGHFFEIVNGHGDLQPLKHTVRVLPGGFVDLDLTADAPGDWAFHCHLLYHMHAGMMRVVKVRPLDGDAA
ncbi:copper resistance system multicopper oxidase [Allosphingosinicella deserti]|uniref:Copper resistance system multicopper oxidase n=1 Tax=Allosphingosinicella deserti TaxID=2116704 RepID=A0A2P7QM23_9SPHN|nr:copper resistance system multicopper oxidase [Sphingomonas deserti]PSJ39017.1 copper resistance system multicopper oxidase [Sphingomonas deserti]